MKTGSSHLHLPLRQADTILHAQLATEGLPPCGALPGRAAEQVQHAQSCLCQCFGNPPCTWGSPGAPSLAARATPLPHTASPHSRQPAMMGAGAPRDPPRSPQGSHPPPPREPQVVPRSPSGSPRGRAQSTGTVPGRAQMSCPKHTSPRAATACPEQLGRSGQSPGAHGCKCCGLPSQTAPLCPRANPAPGPPAAGAGNQLRLGTGVGLGHPAGLKTQGSR